MTKRADGKFERRPHDDYRTPVEAVEPLLYHLAPRTSFIDPCDDAEEPGGLIQGLRAGGHACAGRYGRERGRSAALSTYPTRGVDCFITNPPWTRPVMHGIIENLSEQLPTWLLFDADWMHTVQATRYFPRLVKIVSVGRLKWMPGSDSVGFDNVAWYLFSKRRQHDWLNPVPLFYGRSILPLREQPARRPYPWSPSVTTISQSPS